MGSRCSALWWPGREVHRGAQSPRAVTKPEPTSPGTVPAHFEPRLSFLSLSLSQLSAHQKPEAPLGVTSLLPNFVNDPKCPQSLFESNANIHRAGAALSGAPTVAVCWPQAPCHVTPKPCFSASSRGGWTHTVKVVGAATERFQGPLLCGELRLQRLDSPLPSRLPTR